jgi:hypothetical protein
MDAAVIILALVLGAVIGALIVVGWKSNGKPLIDQFNEMHHAPENIERRSRRFQ